MSKQKISKADTIKKEKDVMFCPRCHSTDINTDPGMGVGTSETCRTCGNKAYTFPVINERELKNLVPSKEIDYDFQRMKIKYSSLEYGLSIIIGILLFISSVYLFYINSENNNNITLIAIILIISGLAIIITGIKRR